MYIHNLDTDWTRKDIATPSTYYGYANPDALASERKWSIRKVTGGLVEWNNNISLKPGAIWDNRVAHFTALGSISGVTYSVIQTGNTFYPEYNLEISWTDLAGSDKYKVGVTDHNNVSYNYLFAPYQNTYQTTPLASESTKSQFNFIGPASMTYSFTIEAVNIASSTQSVVVIST